MLRKTVKPALSKKVNLIDKHIRLVYTGDGPQYVNEEAINDTIPVRRVRDLYFTMEFANQLWKESILSNGKQAAVLARLQVWSRDKGSELVSLYRTHTKVWYPVIEDMLQSPTVLSMKRKLVDELVDHNEYAHLSIDGTLQGTLSLMGQEIFKKPKQSRAQAPFDEVSAMRAVVSVLGRTSAVCDVGLIQNESAEHVANHIQKNIAFKGRLQTKTVSVDNPSAKFWKEARRVLPNLEVMSIDTCHLAMTYEYAHARRHTAGSGALRQVLGKFHQVDTSISVDTWGPVFYGGSAKALAADEQVLANHITARSMNTRRARKILAELDTEKPFYTRVEFIECLAAIASEFSTEVQHVSAGPNRPIYALLTSAVQPARAEWYFNNLRALHMMRRRHLALLPAGTTANEAFHSEVSMWMGKIRKMYQTTLAMKLDLLKVSKQLVHNTALYRPTTKQVPSRMVMGGVLARPLWTPAAWQTFVGKFVDDYGFTRKATLPLTVIRSEQESEVHEWLQKRPAAAPKTRKRTAFTLERVGRLSNRSG